MSSGRQIEHVLADIPVGQIDDADRLRPVDQDYAAMIAVSFEARGQDTAIEVRPAGNGYKLTAGGHRLAAARMLGWETIRAVVVSRSDAEARLAEIDENLMRRDLDALDRAMFLAERKRVWEELHPETAHGGDRKSLGGRKKIKSQTFRLDRFTAEAAKKCGLSERSIQIACQIAAELGPELIMRLRGTALAGNQAALLLLTRLGPTARGAAIDKVREGLSLQEAMREIGARPQIDSDEAQYRKLQAAWDGANAKVRRRFLGYIERRRPAPRARTAAAQED